MNEEWFDRFRQAIERDGRPLRQISLAAGRGVNYVQQTLRDGKEMSANKLMGILAVLGSGAALYVLTGREMNADDEEAFSVILSVDPALRASALRFLRDLKDREDGPAQGSSSQV
jgi:hypothetical protein